MNDKLKIILFLALVFAGVGLRLIFRDLPNFAPVAAISLYAGFVFRSWLLSIMVPLCVLSITNFYLGGYESWAVMVSVYSCLLMPALVAKRILPPAGKVPAMSKVLGWSLAFSLLFFLVTNYASWIQWYPRSVAGFVECYVAAIPFFRFTLLGDLFFCVLFFGGHALALHFANQTRSVDLTRPVQSPGDRC